MTYTPHDQSVDEVRKYLRGDDITAADALAVAEAEAGPDGKGRASVLEAATKRAEQLAAAEPAAEPAVEPEGEPEGEQQGESEGEPEGESVALEDAVAALATPTVQPHRYTGDQWAVGQYAPESVVRSMNRSGQYSSPRSGDLQPGERGDIVVQAGDTITAAVRRTLG